MRSGPPYFIPPNLHCFFPFPSLLSPLMSAPSSPLSLCVPPLSSFVSLCNVYNWPCGFHQNGLPCIFGAPCRPTVWEGECESGKMRVCHVSVSILSVWKWKTERECHVSCFLLCLCGGLWDQGFGEPSDDLRNFLGVKYTKVPMMHRSGIFSLHLTLAS